MRISQHKLFDISSSFIATQTSEAYPIEHLIGYSVQVDYTPDTNFTGQLVIQASNDETNWANAACVDINGTQTTQVINVKDAFYKFVRLKVTVTTGSITSLEAIIYTKGF